MKRKEDKKFVILIIGILILGSLIGFLIANFTSQTNKLTGKSLLDLFTRPNIKIDKETNGVQINNSENSGCPDCVKKCNLCLECVRNLCQNKTAEKKINETFGKEKCGANLESGEICVEKGTCGTSKQPGGKKIDKYCSEGLECCDFEW